MRKSAVVSYFGTQQAAADELGVAQSTFAGWPDPLPLGWAEIIEKGSKRRVKVDYSLYPALPPILQPLAERRQ